ncbi:MAG TPA: YtxH domain-containing protein [Vicinamibacterales bacterium]
MYEMDIERAEYGGGGFMAGLLVGAAVGTAIGMMFAPRSGAEMRHQLKQSGEKLRQTAARTYEQAHGRMEGLKNRGREMMERGREAASEQTGQGEPGQRPFTTPTYPPA